MGTTGGASDGIAAGPSALTTPARIRHRINITDSDISDSDLIEFIVDEQAYIVEFAEKVFSESDAQFGLARSVCTDRCAAKALLHILGISAGIVYSIDELKIDKSDPASTKLSMAKSMWIHAEEQLSLLKPKVSRLRPKASTS